MIQLAICDDESQVLQKAEQNIQDFNRQQNGEDTFSVTSYSSPQVLYDNVIDGEVYDAFLLDIEMEPINGMELAGKLREIFPYAAIVFLSSHTTYSYMYEGYRVQALRYLSKDAMETSMPEALNAIIHHYKSTKPLFYTYTYYSGAERVALQDIIYVHRATRMTEIVTEKQEPIRLKKPLRDIFTELNDKRFLFISRSCFVNADHVVQVLAGTLVLKNGENLKVSRKMMPEVKTSLLRLWGGLT